jgi:mono/diheme cytochrome c family protein
MGASLSMLIAMLVMFGTTGLAPAQNDKGLALVQEHCATCHAIGKYDDSPYPSAPPLRRIGDSYGLDEFEKLLQRGRIIAPHPAMPGFKMSREAARSITRYLRSIQQ